LLSARNRPVILEPATADRVSANDPIAVSVVVPAQDEAPNLVRLVAEVRAALDPLGIAWELIVVDDGSDDDTPALLARLAEAEPPLFDGAHRWLPALFTLAGQRVVQRPVTHHPRTAGESKYTTRGRVVPIACELVRLLALAARRSPARRAVLGLALLALAAF